MVSRSKLYENAVAALNEKASAWEAILSHIENTQTVRYGTSGQDISRIIQTEHQLSDNPQNAEPTIMKDLLLELTDTSWPPPEQTDACATLYIRIVEKRQLYGRPIQFEPDIIYRYVLLYSNSLFIKKIIDSLEKSGEADRADELRRQMQEIANRSVAISWGLLLDSIKDYSTWTKLIRAEIQISGARTAFVTFDSQGVSTQRRSARWLVAALVLPWRPSPPETSMIEFKYHRKSNDRLLFPTLGDAGWWKGFRSAEPGEPHGWTFPSDPTLRQPEAVQDSPTLALLTSPNDMNLVPL
jgi:hypothetical protein